MVSAGKVVRNIKNHLTRKLVKSGLPSDYIRWWGIREPDLTRKRAPVMSQKCRSDFWVTLPLNLSTLRESPVGLQALPSYLNLLRFFIHCTVISTSVVLRHRARRSTVFWVVEFRNMSKFCK